jgi:signal transduction histidine kinase
VVARLPSAFEYLPTITVLVALHTVAVRRSWRVAFLALCLTLVPLVWVAHVAYAERPAGDEAKPLSYTVAFYVLLGVGVWVAGQWRRLVLARARGLERRLAAEAREAAMAERLHLARELHDVVAHAVTIMVLHAAGARRLLEPNPARADEALGQVEEMGRQAMDELRRMLVVLRGDAKAVSTAPEANDSERTPTLSDLPSLIDRVNGAGIPVAFVVDGEPRPAAIGVELVAYRVAQEALTNVTRHAGPGARATLTARWSDSSLDLEITDDGRGDPQAAVQGLSTGNGLRGLSERVAETGGSLTYGPLTDGGFRVGVRLPLCPAPSPTRSPALVTRG